MSGKIINSKRFSNEWESIYLTGKHKSEWPWSDLVSLFYKNCSSLLQKKNLRVLELGCGSGANIPFFISLGVDYFAVDGSETVVKNLHKKFPYLKNNISVADFSIEIPKTLGKEFDLIIDRASITHNSTYGIKKTISLVRSRLAKNGFYIGVDWFSTDHSGYKMGDKGVDRFTRINLPANTEFFKTGNVHFSSKFHLKKLFEKFEIISLNKKIKIKEIPCSKYFEVKWDFVARRI